MLDFKKRRFIISDSLLINLDYSQVEVAEDARHKG